MTKAMKTRDAKGYAYLIANVEQFGNEVVRVIQGGKTIYRGVAFEFAHKYHDKYMWTLCSDVRVDEHDGLVDIVF